MRDNFSFFHTVVNWKFTLNEKIFRQINYLVIHLVKTLLSRKFCQKCVRSNFRNYQNRAVHTAQCHSAEIPQFFVLQCFKSRDDNFSSNYFTSKGQFQTDFSQLLVDPKFLNSYGGQYMTSIAPHKSCNKLDKPWAEKSASEKLPILTKNCRL